MEGKELLWEKEIPIAGPGVNTFGLRVVNRRYRRDNGKEEDWWLAGLPDAVTIVAETPDGLLITVSEFEAAVGEEVFHFPGETLKKGEDPIEGAKRGLFEETGYVPEGEVKLVSTVARDSQRIIGGIHMVLARDCRRVGDSKGGITTRLVEPEEVWERMRGYFDTDPDKVHGGGNSLKAAALVMEELGYRLVKEE